MRTSECEQLSTAIVSGPCSGREEGEEAEEGERRRSRSGEEEKEEEGEGQGVGPGSSGGDERSAARVVAAHRG